MSLPTIRAALTSIGFTADPHGAVWNRDFAGGIRIKCNLGTSPADSKIDYPKAIRKGRKTTATFAQPESLVVLDCVCRLLAQGYAPGSIVLERSYKVGLDPKYLDILVERDGAPYLMVECKTPGTEFKAETARFLASGGQVLTYFVQDRSSEWLVVYTVDFAANKRAESYVGMSAQGLIGSNVEDIYSSWDKETFKTGLFENTPYLFKQPTLLIRDLVDMKQEDGQTIFNEFEEILRRHVVSDKPNAFNKIFNLFICKIFDEQKVSLSVDPRSC